MTQNEENGVWILYEGTECHGKQMFCTRRVCYPRLFAPHSQNQFHLNVNATAYAIVSQYQEFNWTQPLAHVQIDNTVNWIKIHNRPIVVHRLIRTRKPNFDTLWFLLTCRLYNQLAGTLVAKFRLALEHGNSSQVVIQRQLSNQNNCRMDYFLSLR